MALERKSATERRTKSPIYWLGSAIPFLFFLFFFLLGWVKEHETGKKRRGKNQRKKAKIERIQFWEFPAGGVLGRGEGGTFFCFLTTTFSMRCSGYDTPQIGNNTDGLDFSDCAACLLDWLDRLSRSVTAAAACNMSNLHL